LAFGLPAGGSASPAGYAPEVPDMRRRELLTGLAALGSMGWADPAAAESLRHRLARSATDSDQVDLAEWEQIAWDYGTSTATTAPRDLLEDLTVDLALAQEHLGRLHTEADRHTMHRVMAQLCGFLAQATSDLGNPRISLRWWRTAKRLADASTEPSVRVWVRGREIIHGLYDHRPLTELLDAAEETMAITAVPGMGSGSVYAARAQTLALLGRPAEALKALDQVRDVFERLPAAITGDPMSAYTWPEVRLWHTASFVHTYLGNTRQAEVAHANALARYPRQQSAGCVQVRLHQALCLVRQGDVSQGVQHAHLVLDGLPATHRIGMVREVAHHVLQAVPSVEHRRGDVAALRHEISLPSAKSGDTSR
ncbi:MAG: hypothetical protein JXA67_18035, partial [Micromonosporaceae bacterium]|nr:hypothetical protein [Micromonosporaceae bacterium]